VNQRDKGFTIIELLIVLALLAIVSVGIGSSFVNSLRSGRDARRKADLNNIQKALEAYNEDVGTYPTALKTVGLSLCHPVGCATRNYMQIVPADPNSTYQYLYVPSPKLTSYQLYSVIENKNDSGPGINQSGYGVMCGATTTCKFGVASSNATP
jgi:prepilin-type N-terminal cleavage/methylation domain-containing protein